MSTIGERIKYAIDHMDRGEFHAALEHACNAVDVTSQKYYNQNSSRRIYKDLIKEYNWLIEFMAMGGINLDDTLFENFPITEGMNNRPIISPTFADLMYHVVRCQLVHSDALVEGFAFHDSNIVRLADRHITFPVKVIHGLLSIAIFCPVNKKEETAPGYWVGFYKNRLVINDFWGNEEIARHLANRYPMPRVTLENLGGPWADSNK